MDTTTLLTLEIIDMSGNVIRKYTSKKDERYKPYPGGPPAAKVLPASAGLNRFAWDFRGETLVDIPNAFVYGDYTGHRVAPGTYKARLTYKGETSETSFQLLPDPNQKNVTEADWRKQQELLQQLANSITTIHTAVNEMRNVKKQVEHHNSLLKERAEAKELYEAGQTLIKKMETWESNLVETRQKNFQDVINFPSKLNAQYFDLRMTVDVHDPRLTAGAQQRFTDIEKEWTVYKAEKDKLLNTDVVNYNKLFKEKNVPAVITD